MLQQSPRVSTWAYRPLVLPRQYQSSALGQIHCYAGAATALLAPSFSVLRQCLRKGHDYSDRYFHAWPMCPCRCLKEQYPNAQSKCQLGVYACSNMFETQYDGLQTTEPVSNLHKQAHGATMVAIASHSGATSSMSLTNA